MGVPVSKLNNISQPLQSSSIGMVLLVDNDENKNSTSSLSSSSSSSSSTSSEIEYRLASCNNVDDCNEYNNEDDTNHHEYIVVNNYCDNNQFDQLKYIDDSSAETVISNQQINNNDDGNKSISNSIDNKVDDESQLQDNDSGNASISDNHSDDEQQQQQHNPIATKLRKNYSITNSFNTLNLIDNNKSIMMNQFILRRHSTTNTNLNNNRLSIESSSIVQKFEYSKKFSLLIEKLTNGDLIEIRCVCNCQKSPLLGRNVENFIRSSTTMIHSNNRQRFRRSLHRQSFIQRQNYQKSMTIGHSMILANKQKHQNRRNPFQLSNLWLVGSSCVRGSMDDDDDDQHHISTRIESNTLNTDSSTLNSSDYCSEQFHYVYVDRIIRHEPLDMIISQIMFETKEKHWQLIGGNHHHHHHYLRRRHHHNHHQNGQIKSAKISIDYQIRNQYKFSQRILKQTLNVIPNVEQIRNILIESKDSYVRYNKTLLNSEHYVTLWKYGIGWSTWANQRCDILRTIRLFVERFSTLVIPDDNDHDHIASNINTSSSSSSTTSKILLQNGECLLLSSSSSSSSMENQLQTNLIVQCFGLQDRKINHAIQQWIQWQVVINNKKFNNNYQQQSPSSSTSSPPIVMMNDDDDNNNDKTIDDSNVSCHDVDVKNDDVDVVDDHPIQQKS
ncbi:hypothetical protein DERF_011772 [Dermatophagoides farinae]|uniref:Uncharacterized protein n=1 Tax=Dermatophagoides farinae TaxID=6954 RepID=A0A922L539_DERFA|nr:hypothetical protein DERF_011772 [Dermatophagoides farinae]